jgi:hypothetical protein
MAAEIGGQPSTFQLPEGTLINKQTDVWKVTIFADSGIKVSFSVSR